MSPPPDNPTGGKRPPGAVHDPAGEHLTPRSPIQVLPEGVANRIAAGEVVERPASVVKELVENALDAHATSIVVGVRKAGLEEILVSDDGWGMDEDDIALAFRRHATSKIRAAEDLQRILNLGFRGEALPSIGSVARVEVVSRREDREDGVALRLDGGEGGQVRPAPRERGTTVKVRSLFFNVPARRKFLRTPATEYGHVVRTVKQYAIAYPDIRWELHRDGDPVWHFEPADLRGRLAQIFGEEVLEDLHDVESRSGDVFVTGVVGGTSLMRRSRGDQFLFVNRRPFQSPAINHAVVNGYGQLIYPGQYPFYAVNLRLDPEAFDVNVHPAKHEVRFKDDSLAYRAVLVAVRNALGLAVKGGGAPVQAPLADREREGPEGRDGLKELQLLFGRREAGDEEGETAVAVPRPPKPGEKLFRRGQELEQRGEHGPASGALAAEAARSYQGESASGPRQTVPIASAAPGEAEGESAEAEPEGTAAGEEARQPLRAGIYPHEPSSAGTGGRTSERVNVWQLHKTYILSQTKSGLVIIDQHVAHERILFERALKAMRGAAWSGQQLLFPAHVRLDPGDSALLEELAEGLVRIGFEVEPFGGSEWVIRAVPASVRVSNEEKLLREMLSDYREEHEVRLQPEESLAASFACKAAIKAGDPLNLEEMNTLIDELFTTEYPFVCPHGRPVVVNLTLGELHKLFGRE